MNRAGSLHLVVLALLLASTTIAAGAEVGPTNGSLIVAGGGVTDPAIYERFVALAGGPEAPIVVIPTAGSGETYGDFWPGLKRLRDAGATHITVLHTRDRREADRE